MAANTPTPALLSHLPSLQLGFLPDLTPSEFAFALLVFTAFICLLMNIQPVVIMGGALFVWTLVFVDFAGITPVGAVIIILIAALLRIAANGVIRFKDSDPSTKAMVLNFITSLVKAIANRRSDTNTTSTRTTRREDD